MIKVVAKFVIKKEKIDEVKSITKDLIEKTRKEDGNIKYELYQGTDNPQIFSFIEEWKSKDALEAHMGTEHFKKAVPELENISVSEPEINTYKLII
jgi:quinol monooxygenase YgiN